RGRRHSTERRPRATRCRGTEVAPHASLVLYLARVPVAVMVGAMLLAASPAEAHLLSRTGTPAALRGVRRAQRLVLDRATLADLRARDRSVVRQFPLAGDRTVDLVLTRFELFAPGARAEVMEAGGPRALALPDQVYF